MTQKQKRLFITIIVWALVIIYLVPTLWFFLTSFKTRVDAFAMPPKLFFDPIIKNYIVILQDTSFLRYYMNSVIIAISTCGLSLVIGVPAAYAFSSFDFKKKEDLAFWVLSTRMAPPILVILPFYLFFKEIHLLNTRIAMIIVYTTFNLAFVVWMMKGYFDSMPKDLEEAARIDGATRLHALVRIIIPMSAPGLAASMVFAFIMSWNEYFYALILSGSRSQTVPVAINAFITLVGIRWGQVAAAGTLILIPVILFGVIVRRYIVSGLTMGAIKS